mmetsp:Transcript_2661/g.3799  ORF Transcript_2661/g.3799 Transcript_2661/m.3799 type:complete len:245 (-) Transcript_2661:56-790(-)
MVSSTILALFVILAAVPIGVTAFSNGHHSYYSNSIRRTCLHDATGTAETFQLGQQICTYKTITITPSGMNEGELPRQAVSVEDLTPHLESYIEASGMKNGVLTVISRHTTTALTINELESRLARDVEEFFLKVCPPDERSESEKKQAGVRYLHNDIDQRPDGEDEQQRCRDNGWDIDDDVQLQKWRDQEPINAHSHLISMMLGSSESIPVVDGKMVIGQWQSVLLVDLDGPRTRTVGIQLMGNS